MLFVPASFFLKYCEIMYCLCAICLFSWTILALVKLLKVLELQRKTAKLIGWLGMITAGRSLVWFTIIDFFKST